MTPRPALLQVALAVCIASACGSAPAPATGPRASGGSDAAQAGPEQQTGHFRVHVLSARCGILSVFGTHGEFMPAHPLCRLRIRIRSESAGVHAFRVSSQRLVLRDGTHVPPHPDAMRIKRQPSTVELGAGNAHELDLWFGAPGAPSAVLLVGDRDPDPTGTTVGGARNADGVLVPLRGLE